MFFGGCIYRSMLGRRGIIAIPHQDKLSNGEAVALCTSLSALNLPTIAIESRDDRYGLVAASDVHQRAVWVTGIQRARQNALLRTVGAIEASSAVAVHREALHAAVVSAGGYGIGFDIAVDNGVVEVSSIVWIVAQEIVGITGGVEGFDGALHGDG